MVPFARNAQNRFARSDRRLEVSGQEGERGGECTVDTAPSTRAGYTKATQLFTIHGKLCVMRTPPNFLRNDTYKGTWVVQSVSI